MKDGPIVVGLDDSLTAYKAVSWAADLAAGLDREFVVGYAYAVSDHTGGPDAAAGEAAAELTSWLGAADTAPLRSESIRQEVVSGRPGSALVELAELSGAGLLVVGAHSGPRLGRVVHHVTGHAHCPVAVVRHPGGPVGSAPVLVGVDSANWNSAVPEVASALAGSLGVTMEAASVRADDDEDDFRRAEELLEKLVSPEAPPIRFSELSGDPAGELLDRADEIDALGVVVGQKRGLNVGGRVLGRVPAALLHRAERPIIVVDHG